MVCVLCGSDRLELFCEGLRDRADIDMLKCCSCGLMQISAQGDFSEEYYEDGGMHNQSYAPNSDAFKDQEYSEWVEQSREDDLRRVNQFIELCKDKKVLDFGCGAGGFLKGIKAYSPTTKVVGIELDAHAREMLKVENIPSFKSIDDINETFDVIAMFHVIEHLDDPQKFLFQIRNKLNKDGILIIETPNAADALMSLYESDSFKKFTMWSAHVRLYNSDNLSRLLTECGFATKNATQVQRYPIANHLYWLTHHKPGGHKKWAWLNDNALNERYHELLSNAKMCDTLLSVFVKVEG